MTVVRQRRVRPDPLNSVLVYACVCAATWRACAQTAPAFTFTTVSTCDFITSAPGTSSNPTAPAAPCLLSDFNTSTTSLAPGQVRIINFTNAEACASGIQWGGLSYSVALYNNQPGSQALFFAFGVAINQSAAQACLSTLFAGGACNPAQAWNVYTTGLQYPITSTLTTTQKTIASQGGLVGLVTAGNLTALLSASANPSFVVFMASMSSLPLSATFSTFSVTPTFKAPPSPPPSPSPSAALASIQGSALLSAVLASVALLLLLQQHDA